MFKLMRKIRGQYGLLKIMFYLRNEVDKVMWNPTLSQEDKERAKSLLDAAEYVIHVWSNWNIY